MSERLNEWVKYTLDRAKLLESDMDKASDLTARYRLRTKAGCFRSLAYEVQQILSENK